MKWIVVSGIVLAGAVAALVLVSGGDSSEAKRPNRTPDESTASAAGAATGKSPVPPKRFTSGGKAEAEPAPQPLDAFFGQDTDSSWAGAQATRIGDIATKLVGDSPVSVSDVECRTTLCRFVVKSSDPDAFMRVIEDMQSHEGYVGVAESMLLTGLTKADGAQEVSVVLEFVR